MRKRLIFLNLSNTRDSRFLSRRYVCCLFAVNLFGQSCCCDFCFLVNVMQNMTQHFIQTIYSLCVFSVAIVNLYSALSADTKQRSIVVSLRLFTFTWLISICTKGNLRYRGGNSTTTEEVSRFQCLFPNPNWLLLKGIPPRKTRSNFPWDRQLPYGD